MHFIRPASSVPRTKAYSARFLKQSVAASHLTLNVALAFSLLLVYILSSYRNAFPLFSICFSLWRGTIIRPVTKGTMSWYRKVHVGLVMSKSMWQMCWPFQTPFHKFLRHWNSLIKKKAKKHYLYKF